jgi:membrane-associated phospholipid phosphatase
MNSDLCAIMLVFWEYIQPFDAWLLKHINQDWSSSFLDAVLPYLRETKFWVPLYLFLGIFIVMNFGAKGWWWIMGFVLVAATSDIISSKLIKPYIIRDRPCRDVEVMQLIRFFVNYCPGSSSFTSSHATSHTAQAMFIFLTLRHVIGKWALLFFVWAFLIAYTQVYVGVHYPFDVICGGLLGCGIGFALSKLFHNRVGMLSLDK